VSFCVSIGIDNVTGSLYGYVDVTWSIWKSRGNLMWSGKWPPCVNCPRGTHCRCSKANKFVKVPWFVNTENLVDIRAHQRRKFSDDVLYKSTLTLTYPFTAFW